MSSIGAVFSFFCSVEAAFSSEASASVPGTLGERMHVGISSSLSLLTSQVI